MIKNILFLLLLVGSCHTFAQEGPPDTGDGSECPEWAENCSEHNTIVILPPDAGIVYDHFEGEFVAYCTLPSGGVNCIAQVLYSWVEDNKYMVRYIFCRDVNNNNNCDSNGYVWGGQHIVENRTEVDHQDLTYVYHRQEGIANDIDRNNVHPDHVPEQPNGWEECPFGCF